MSSVYHQGEYKKNLNEKKNWIFQKERVGVRLNKNLDER